MTPPDPNANPYAATQATHAQVPAYGYGPPAASPALYTYREGDALVHPLGTWLPPVCMKCGRPDGLVSREHVFVYTPMQARLAGLATRLAMRKTAKMAIPLCSPCNDRWRKARIATGIVLGAFFASLVSVPVAAAANVAETIPLVLSGIAFVSIFVVAFAMVRPALLRVKKIDATHIWLLGVAPHLIEQLPPKWEGLR